MDGQIESQYTSSVASGAEEDEAEGVASSALANGILKKKPKIKTALTNEYKQRERWLVFKLICTDIFSLYLASQGFI
jgi:hypothetical protein